MRLVDLHCDSLYECVKQNIGLNNSLLENKLDNTQNFENKLQCYAIWIPDDVKPLDAEKLFYKAKKCLAFECDKNNIKLIKQNENIKDNFYKYKNTALFTIENGTALNCKLSNIKKYAEYGVKIITLTWNAHNCIGDGSSVVNANGITPFGIDVIKEMENNKIIVDVSHASDKLFYDVTRYSTKPFIATHSNSRTVTNHKRNLTDEQFEIIKNKKGLVGLNFHISFLNNCKNKASMQDLFNHTEHFLSLGGQNCLCIGSDFDGGTLPKDILGSQSMYNIFNMFLRLGYSEELVNKIFFLNAINFFENFDNN